jgi:hypothetical protein
MDGWMDGWRRKEIRKDDAGKVGKKGAEEGEGR